MNDIYSVHLSQSDLFKHVNNVVLAPCLKSFNGYPLLFKSLPKSLYWSTRRPCDLLSFLTTLLDQSGSCPSCLLFIEYAKFVPSAWILIATSLIKPILDLFSNITSLKIACVAKINNVAFSSYYLFSITLFCFTFMYFNVYAPK